jgi:hypothetical protein
MAGGQPQRPCPVRNPGAGIATLGAGPVILASWGSVPTSKVCVRSVRGIKMIGDALLGAGQQHVLI